MPRRKAALVLILFAFVLVMPHVAGAIQCACGLCCYRGACSQGPYDPFCFACESGTAELLVGCEERVYYGAGVFVKQGTGGRCIYRCNYDQECADYAWCNTGSVYIDGYTLSDVDKFKTVASYPPGACPAYDCATQSPAAAITLE